jgi:hypothetical protein
VITGVSLFKNFSENIPLYSKQNWAGASEMTTKKRRKQGSGWVKIQTPQDLRAAIQRMINKILMGKAPLDHAGTFAQLANAWTNSFKAEMTLIEMKELEERISELEDLRKYEESKRNEGLDEMDRARKELKALMKQWR